MARLLAVAPTEEKAAEVARRGAGWIVGSYMGPHAAMIFDPTNLTGLTRSPIRSSARYAAR